MNFIDKDILLQRINTQFWSEIENIINSAPSIDIVRCKECKWYKQGETICNKWEGLMQVFPDEFCSYGEVRDE